MDDSSQKKIAEVLQEREDYPYGKPRPYTPDHPKLLVEGLPIPPAEDTPGVSGRFKFVLILLAILIALYGVHGLATDDLYLPVERSPAEHYHGVAAWPIFGMLISISACLIIMALSKYDAVQRRMTYKVPLTLLSIGVICLMLVGITMGIIYR